MRSDRPLIVAVVLLAIGLTLIIGYGTGTAGFNMAYPVSGANLQMSISTYGPAALGGVLLTALGLIALIWALICAVIGPVRDREIVRMVPEQREVVKMVPEQRVVATEPHRGWFPKRS